MLGDFEGGWGASDGAKIVVDGTRVTRNGHIAGAKLERRSGDWYWVEESK